MIVIHSLKLFGKTNLHFAFTGCCGRPTVSTARRPRSNSYSALDSTSDDGGTLEECKTLSNKKPVIYITHVRGQDPSDITAAPLIQN